jgi:LacI family transcriptional regulator
MPTIRELARRAGVSTASVSRALNNLPGVAETTRERIAALAREIGYTADERARALVTGQVPFLGLVVPDIANPYYPEVARGAEEELLERGYSLLLISTDWQLPRLRRAFELLTARRVAGLLIAVPVNGELEAVGIPREQLARSIALLGQAAPGPGPALASVEVDDRHGGWLVGQHLIARGWQKIAYLAGPERDRAARERLAGLRRALAEAGNERALCAVAHGEWSIASGHAQAGRLLDLDLPAAETRGAPKRAGSRASAGARRRSAPPIAIFAANDLLALGVAQAASERGLRLGQDLGLVGYDDIDPVRFLEVPLTTVAQPKRELGRLAARLLLARIAGEEPRSRIRLKPSLVVRGSCGATRAEQEARGSASKPEEER